MPFCLSQPLHCSFFYLAASLSVSVGENNSLCKTEPTWCFPRPMTVLWCCRLLLCLDCPAPGHPRCCGSEPSRKQTPPETQGEGAGMHCQLGNKMAWSLFVLPSHQRGPCLNSSPFSLEEKGKDLFLLIATHPTRSKPCEKP